MITPIYEKLSKELRPILKAIDGKQANKPTMYNIKYEYLKHYHDEKLVKNLIKCPKSMSLSVL
jgi:hypothetical protein